jgi:DNA-binding transcriptional LysR family regulator
MMTLREFQYVIAIVEEKSISKAARRLHIAQPSLTLYLQRLESKLECKLFDRTVNSMSLTESGAIYLKKARQILALEEELTKELQDREDMKKGHITLAMTPFWALRFLPQVLTVFHSLYPGIEIQIREGSALDIIRWANEYETDLTVLSVPEPVKEEEFGLKFDYLKEYDVCAVVATSYPITDQAKENNPYLESTSQKWIDMHTLRNEPFILQVPGCTLRYVADSLFQKYKITPHIVHEVQYAETAESLAAAGIGVAFVVGEKFRFSHSKPHPQYFSIGVPPAKILLSVAWVKNRYLTRAAKEFVNISSVVLKKNLDARDGKYSETN